MTLKVLLLNFPKDEILSVPDGLKITQFSMNRSVKAIPTLHDYHVIILDTDEILEEQWWLKENDALYAKTVSIETLKSFNEMVNEQIETGGVTFCFSGPQYFKKIKAPRFVRYSGQKDWDLISNYFFCPIDLGIVNKTGDTFYPRFEELKYFTPLIKKTPLDEIYWSCYFSTVPKKAKVLGVNRAGYSVFMEVPLGSGRLVMLPRFKNRAHAVTLIVNEVIPQMIHEEEFTFVPQWLQNYSSPYEIQLRNTLKEIEEAKRLLFTKGKLLKKAVAFAFEKIGFNVEILPDGTLPDLRIIDGDSKAIIEVKGHENKQSDRGDILQILSYITETETIEKGIVVSNHECNKNPNERKKEAFTEGAIQLAQKIDIALISSIDLYNIVMGVLEGKLNEDALKKIRKKIMSEAGVVGLNLHNQ